jgi:hypothetical protein
MLVLVLLTSRIGVNMTVDPISPMWALPLLPGPIRPSPFQPNIPETKRGELGRRPGHQFAMMQIELCHDVIEARRIHYKIGEDSL